MSDALNTILQGLLVNPIVAEYDQDGWHVRKYANGQAECEREVTFTTPTWSGSPNLYYCIVVLPFTPPINNPLGTMVFGYCGGGVVRDALIQFGVASTTVNLVRFYGGTDPLTCKVLLKVYGKWK